MKLLFIIFGIAFFYTSVYAQGQPTELWQAIEPAGSVNIKSPTIALDGFQNTYMLTNQTDERPLGGFTLVKYDTLGNLLWKQNSTGSFSGIFYGSFLVDTIGNVYVSENYDGGLPGYDADAILVKYDPDGTKLWMANYGLNQVGDSYIYYSEMDTLNGRLITLGMNLHDTALAENFLFVQAIDTSDGSVIWNTKIFGVFRPQNLRIQSDHIQLLATDFTSNGKYFVNAMLDFDGNLTAQYQKPYSGYAIDFNYISRTGDVIFGNRAFGYTVTRINIEGDTLWGYEPQNIIYSIKNKILSISEDEDLNIYATGAVESLSLGTEQLTLKFDKLGNVLWENTYNSYNDSLVDYGIYSIPYKNYLFVTGGTQLENMDIIGIMKIFDKNTGSCIYEIKKPENNIFVINKSISKGDKVFYSAEGFQQNLNNILVVTGCFQLPEITSYNETKTTLAVTLGPNPAADYVNVLKIDTNVLKKIIIYDVNGKIMIIKGIEDKQEQIDISNLKSGIYLVSVCGKGLCINKKIIKI